MTDNVDYTLVLTQEKEQLIQVMQSHATLQHQFEQLTKHVEQCYMRIQTIESNLIAANKTTPTKERWIFNFQNMDEHFCTICKQSFSFPFWMDHLEVCQ